MRPTPGPHSFMSKHSYVIAGLGKRSNGLPYVRMAHDALTGGILTASTVPEACNRWLPCARQVAGVYKIMEDRLSLAYKSASCKSSVPATIKLSPVWQSALDVRRMPAPVMWPDYRSSNALENQLKELRDRWNMTSWPLDDSKTPGVPGLGNVIDSYTCYGSPPPGNRVLVRVPRLTDVAVQLHVYVHTTVTRVEGGRQVCEISLAAASPEGSKPVLFSVSFYRHLLRLACGEYFAGWETPCVVSNGACFALALNSLSFSFIPLAIQLAFKFHQRCVSLGQAQLDVIVTT